MKKLTKNTDLVVVILHAKEGDAQVLWGVTLWVASNPMSSAPSTASFPKIRSVWLRNPKKSLWDEAAVYSVNYKTLKHVFFSKITKIWDFSKTYDFAKFSRFQKQLLKLVGQLSSTTASRKLIFCAFERTKWGIPNACSANFQVSESAEIQLHYPTFFLKTMQSILMDFGKTRCIGAASCWCLVIATNSCFWSFDRSSLRDSIFWTPSFTAVSSRNRPCRKQDHCWRSLVRSFASMCGFSQIMKSGLSLQNVEKKLRSTWAWSVLILLFIVAYSRALLELSGVQPILMLAGGRRSTQDPGIPDVSKIQKHTGCHERIFPHGENNL